MKNKPPATSGRDALRRRAEARLRRRKLGMVSGAEDADRLRLVHELEVHQVELEMQNEELRRTRNETEDSLRRYTELFEFSPLGLFVLGSDGRIRRVNLAGARFCNMPRQPLLGRSFGLFVAANHRPALNQFLTRVIAQNPENRTAETCELAWDVNGIGTRDVHLTGAALEEQEIAVLVAFEDITTRKAAEDALRLESRNKDAFLAVLSHELRNPLATMRSGLVLVAGAEPGSEQARKGLAVLDRQITHLARLVDDLLDVARISRDQVDLKCDLLEFGDLVRRTMDDHRPTFLTGGVALEARLGSELFWIRADATRIVQMFGNLLGNAAKFTLRGGKVEILLRREGRTVVLLVSDTGIGISAEVRERLFTPFAQAPQTLARSHGGLGLGLAMVKRIVELHAGTVEVASRGLGQGAEFSVRLPLVEGPSKTTAPATKRQIPHRRVLVIEDHEDAAETLSGALTVHGHDVHVAYDGPTGLALARSLRPDILICDIGLPGMDGYDVARAFRADELLKSTYLIALTGYAFAEDLERAATAGFDRHVAKPPDLEKLEDLFLESSRSSGPPTLA